MIKSLGISQAFDRAQPENANTYQYHAQSMSFNSDTCIDPGQQQGVTFQEPELQKIVVLKSIYPNRIFQTWPLIA